MSDFLDRLTSRIFGDPPDILPRRTAEYSSAPSVEIQPAPLEAGPGRIGALPASPRRASPPWPRARAVDAAAAPPDRSEAAAPRPPAERADPPAGAAVRPVAQRPEDRRPQDRGPEAQGRKLEAFESRRPEAKVPATQSPEAQGAEGQGAKARGKAQESGPAPLDAPQRPTPRSVAGQSRRVAAPVQGGRAGSATAGDDAVPAPSAARVDTTAPQELGPVGAPRDRPDTPPGLPTVDAVSSARVASASHTPATSGRRAHPVASHLGDEPGRPAAAPRSAIARDRRAPEAAALSSEAAAQGLEAAPSPLAEHKAGSSDVAVPAPEPPAPRPVSEVAKPQAGQVERSGGRAPEDAERASHEGGPAGRLDPSPAAQRRPSTSARGSGPRDTPRIEPGAPPAPAVPAGPPPVPERRSGASPISGQASDASAPEPTHHADPPASAAPPKDPPSQRGPSDGPAASTASEPAPGRPAHGARAAPAPGRAAPAAGAPTAQAPSATAPLDGDETSIAAAAAAAVAPAAAPRDRSTTARAAGALESRPVRQGRARVAEPRPPILEILIDRIDVVAAPPRPRAASARKPALSLADYLRRDARK